MKFHQSPATYIGNVHLSVSDLEKSRVFYEKTLGLKVIEEKENLITLGADVNSTLVILEKVKGAQPRAPRSTGLYHLAFLVPSRKDLADVLLHLMNIGYPLHGASDHLFSEAIYLADPDGNGIEIYRDLPPEQWVWQDGELPFVSNPINVRGLLQEATNDQWSGFPKATVIGHIHLNVSDLEKERTFYVDGLGFDITVPFRHQALFVATEGYHHHIGMNTWNGKGAPAPAENSLGMISYSLIFQTEEERNLTADRLGKMGYEAIVKDGVVWTKDHSGNRIELQIK